MAFALDAIFLLVCMCTKQSHCIVNHGRAYHGCQTNMKWTDRGTLRAAFASYITTVDQL